jgi:hypothetical protein
VFDHPWVRRFQYLYEVEEIPRDSGERSPVSNGRSLSNSMIEEVLNNDKKDEIMKDIETFIN